MRIDTASLENRKLDTFVRIVVLQQVARSGDLREEQSYSLRYFQCFAVTV